MKPAPRDETASRAVARAALHLASTLDRAEEGRLKAEFARTGIRTAAVDVGGSLPGSLPGWIERVLVAAKREGLITDNHAELGAVAGAAHQAAGQLVALAAGLNAGGKAAVARQGGHLAVAFFVSVGLLHLNDVGVGLAHRAIAPGDWGGSP